MDGFRSNRALARATMAMTILWAGVTAAAPVAIRDRAVVAENSAVTVDVMANDTPGGAISELRISSPPQGTAEVDTRGTADAADDRIAYATPANFTGEDVFSYQICVEAGGCAESQLHVTVRPHVDVQFDTATGTGFADIELDDLRDLPDVMFRTTPLEWPLVDTPALTVDPTPLDPWDSTAGLAVVARTIPAPASSQPLRYRVLVDARGDAGDIDVYLGIDANGNSLPDPGEIECTGAMTATVERCEIDFTVPIGTDVTWWVAFHNRHTATQNVRSEAFEVVMDANSDGTFVATGPGDVPPLIEFPVRLAWHEPMMLDGVSRLGYVRVVSEGTEIGVFPVRIDRVGTDDAPILLGRSSKMLALDAQDSHWRMFVDVPPGATELRVLSNSGVNTNLYVGRGDDVVEPAVGSLVDVVASSEGAGGLEVITITGDALEPGRWYVGVSNTTSERVGVTVQATVTGDAPDVRSGSYFNPDRSGHGVFLYPAGDQLTGLWYTYFQDRTPTWYYLQATQPPANGIWQSELFRAAWDGDSRELVAVGSVVLTPVGPDTFRWSYRIDGETGSETFESLGRGCPTLGGDLVDASSTWYDPAHAGTGFSVQYWPDYEYYAAFVYDALGVPRFITSERTSFGDEDEIIDLEQLLGFCPLCERTGPPERSEIGVLGRSFDNVPTLDLIALVGVFEDGVPGEWSSDDEVVPLGGAGTTQGCDP